MREIVDKKKISQRCRNHQFSNGSSFEQLSWLVYDSMIVDLKKATGQEQKDMDDRHANME
ncbi:hypothetical protein [Candidatus Enterococcus ferrettii]|uniref:hypothetical protein n=1 Tax=Candidatus Enterococcus ferrettii TaxID=2815324 RepID=UPI001A9A98CA|nr:hypothetical protein [Enterococcus sp. 665A]MBO1341600.1 hypothetical protein [Enterococcus sp. 665A]